MLPIGFDRCGGTRGASGHCIISIADFDKRSVLDAIRKYKRLVCKSLSSVGWHLHGLLRGTTFSPLYNKMKLQVCKASLRLVILQRLFLINDTLVCAKTLEYIISTLHYYVCKASIVICALAGVRGCAGEEWRGGEISESSLSSERPRRDGRKHWKDDLNNEEYNLWCELSSRKMVTLIVDLIYHVCDVTEPAAPAPRREPRRGQTTAYIHTSPYDS